MGFGILFFGYFLSFAFSVSEIYFFSDVIGGIVMLAACRRLMQYNRYYVGAAYSIMAFVLLSLGKAGFLIFPGMASGVWGTVADVAQAVAACVVHVLLFLGIRGISAGAGCQKLVKKAERCLVMTVLYYLAAHVVLLTGSLYAETAAYISLWIFVYWWVCFVFNLALIYQAFGLLYSEEEEEKKEKKRSRFRVINYINDKMDQFEENANQYRRESMKMAMEEAERMHQEKGQGRKKSKKKKK